MAPGICFPACSAPSRDQSRLHPSSGPPVAESSSLEAAKLRLAPLRSSKHARHDARRSRASEMIGRAQEDLQSRLGASEDLAFSLTRRGRRLLDTGAVKRRADLAMRYKISRARVTQLLDLHKLHPDIPKLRAGARRGARTGYMTRRYRNH